ncbi:MAG: hypothetical protein NTX33_07965 [Propionibacteriales bacterium]|nr:hypothetical protein [Propionibacteriales bacterium]
MTDTSPEHPGDPRHPEHEAWLLELGRATYAAARVAGICFDLARVVGEVESTDMYSDPLGTLLGRLRSIAGLDLLSGLPEFVEQVDAAREDRNDLLHALPVLHGLHRRKTKDPAYVRNFFDLEQLSAVTEQLSDAARQGNQLLYQDGGEAVRRWYERRRN